MTETNTPSLAKINRQHIKQHFSQAAPSYDDAAILQKTIAKHMNERLDLTTIQPKTILDLGAGTGLLTQKLIIRYPSSRILAVDLSFAMLQQAQPRLKTARFPLLGDTLNKAIGTTLAQKTIANAINADAYQLPFADQSMDLIVSNLMLQWCDDLDNVFQELRRVLRPEGLLMFSTFGPDTLKELRQAWKVADEKQEHVNQFIDMHDIGDALIRNGFGQPVMDMERFTLTYDQPINVLKDLKAIGATNANTQRNPGLMGKNRFNKMLNAYEQFRQDNKVSATYEVIHGHAWASTEHIQGPNRNKPGHIEISLEAFSKQIRQ